MLKSGVGITLIASPPFMVQGKTVGGIKVDHGACASWGCGWTGPHMKIVEVPNDTPRLPPHLRMATKGLRVGGATSLAPNVASGRGSDATSCRAVAMGWWGNPTGISFSGFLPCHLNVKSKLRTIHLSGLPLDDRFIPAEETSYSSDSKNGKYGVIPAGQHGVDVCVSSNYSFATLLTLI